MTATWETIAQQLETTSDPPTYQQALSFGVGAGAVYSHRVIAKIGSVDSAGRALARIDPWVSVNDSGQVGFRATTVGPDSRHRQNVFTSIVPAPGGAPAPIIPLMDPSRELPESGAVPWQVITPPQLNNNDRAVVRRYVTPILTLNYIDFFTGLPANMTQNPPMTYIETWRVGQTSVLSAQLIQGADPGIRPLVENVFPLILNVAFFNPQWMGCWPQSCGNLNWLLG